MVKRDFHADVPLVVHWDGELMEELTTKQHVDRLPILVSGEGMEKLIGVPKLSGGGMGENQASAVITALEEWGISESSGCASIQLPPVQGGDQGLASALSRSWVGSCSTSPVATTS